MTSLHCRSGLAALILLAALLPAAAVGAADAATVPELLAAPAAAEGRVVAVHGYLRPHVLYLFPNRELADARDWRAALIIGDDPSGSIRDSECPDRFVTVTGTFRNLDPGIYGLVEIARIETDDGTICWQTGGAGPAR